LNGLGYGLQAPHPNAARLFADFLKSKEGFIASSDMRAVPVNSSQLGKFSGGNQHLGRDGIYF
jgi:hypothetical protein